MPINIVKMYYNLVSVLYIKELIFKVVIVISIIFTVVSKWLKAILASSIVINIALLNSKGLN